MPPGIRQQELEPESSVCHTVTEETSPLPHRDAGNPWPPWPPARRASTLNRKKAGTRLRPGVGSCKARGHIFAISTSKITEDAKDPAEA